jgi:DNA-binding transcriptional ArsR family regulator
MNDRDWVRLPTRWILDEGLRQYRWGANQGSNAIAALMLLAVIAHHADGDTGVAFLTYDQLTHCTGLSRAKVAGGLTVLAKQELIERQEPGRSGYKLANYAKERGWGKLPARRLYSRDGEIPFFHELKLRSRTELDALKLFFLFVERRSEKTNLAHISYDKITEYSGLDRSAIRRGLSLLAANGIVHVQQISSQESEHGFANAYRLAHLDPRVHPGTSLRGMSAAEIAEAVAD